MEKNKFIVLLVLTFYLLQLTLVTGKELTVVYTANTTGKLRICGCPEDPYGGLAERVTLIRRLRKIEQEPFLLVDAGNMVNIFGDYEKEASRVIRVMNLMNYQAAGVGCYEIFHGIESALKIENEALFPFLSSTITAKDTSRKIFTPYVISKVGEISAGIISLFDSSSLYRIGDPKDIEFDFLSAHIILKKILQGMHSTSDYIIVISHLHHTTNKDLIQTFPEIDLIIEAYSDKKYEQPVVEPEGIIVSPGKKGRYVGIIVIDKSEKGTVTMKDHEFIPVLNFPPDRKALTIITEN